MKWGNEEEFWNDYAEVYPLLEKAPPYQKLWGEIKRELLMLPNAKWLDIGTGTGKGIEALLKLSELLDSEIHIIGIDNSEIMLSHAQTRLYALTLDKTSKVELIKMDISEKLPQEWKNQFDGVLANLSITYLPEYQGQKGLDGFGAMLSEIASILRDNGQLVWTTPKKGAKPSRIFLASLKVILDDLVKSRSLQNFFCALKILNFSKELRRKAKQGIIFFPDEKQIEAAMCIFFHKVKIKSVYEDQAWLVSGIKKDRQKAF